MSLYGVTFAQKLLSRGQYEEAIKEATAHARREPESPEPYHDRARAYGLLNRYQEAYEDYQTAIELDRVEQILPDHEIDDGVFSLLIAWAQSLPSKEEQIATVRRYPTLLPQGSHLAEAHEWEQRFAGLLKSTWAKPQD